MKYYDLREFERLRNILANEMQLLVDDDNLQDVMEKVARILQDDPVETKLLILQGSVTLVEGIIATLQSNDKEMKEMKNAFLN